MATSAYEAWVTAIRAWRDDPQLDLSSLPPLSVDSLPPAAYERLFEHIRSAQQVVMQRWSETFARDWGGAKDDHARTRALVAARVLLARRLQLAGHPGLPEVVRSEFTQGVERDIRTLQSELEDAVVKQSGHRVDRMYVERMLRLLRENRLTAIIEPGFSLQALVEGRLEQSECVRPLPQPGSDSVALQPDPPRRRYRAIIVDS